MSEQSQSLQFTDSTSENSLISEDTNTGETKAVRIVTNEKKKEKNYTIEEDEKDVFYDDDEKGDLFQTLGGIPQDSRIVKGERLARNINVSVGSMAITGTIAQVLRMELCWDDVYLILLRGDKCPSGLYLGFFTIATTITTICLLFAFYYYRSMIEKARWGYSTYWDAFSKTKLWWKLAIEIIFLLIQPYPRIIPTTFSYPEVLVLFMMFRFVYVGRAIRDYSELYQNRGVLKTDILPSGEKVFHSVGTSTVFKIYFLRYSGNIIAFSYLFFWFFFSYLIYITERGYYLPLEGNNADGITAALDLVDPHNKMVPDTDLWETTPYSAPWTCMWMTAITMLTVGYGDFYAYTPGGKVIAMVSCLAGIILTSLVASAVTAAVSESTPFELLLSEWLRDFELRNVAAQMIQINWKKKSLKMNRSEERQFDRKREKVKKKLKALRVIPPEPAEEGENRKNNLAEVKKVNDLFRDIGMMIYSSGALTKDMKKSFRKSFRSDKHRRSRTRSSLTMQF